MSEHIRARRDAGEAGRDLRYPPIPEPLEVGTYDNHTHFDIAYGDEALSTQQQLDKAETAVPFHRRRHRHSTAPKPAASNERTDGSGTAVNCRVRSVIEKPLKPVFRTSNPTRRAQDVRRGVRTWSPGAQADVARTCRLQPGCDNPARRSSLPACIQHTVPSR